MTIIKPPYIEEKIRSLKKNDRVEISGNIFTARDAVHKYLFEGGKLPISLENQIIFHCGPIVIQENGIWQVKAAGPTTSMREEPYAWKLIEQYNLRGIIGKGGMGAKTQTALQNLGACYFHTIGGAAQVLAARITKVKNVYLLEKFGVPEAIWEFEVKNFPVIVTMDSHGNS